MQKIEAMPDTLILSSDQNWPMGWAGHGQKQASLVDPRGKSQKMKTYLRLKIGKETCKKSSVALSKFLLKEGLTYFCFFTFGIFYLFLVSHNIFHWS